MKILSMIIKGLGIMRLLEFILIGIFSGQSLTIIRNPFTNKDVELLSFKKTNRE